MRRLLSLALVWLVCTALIAEARFVKTWYNPLTAAVLPFQGLGDALGNVIVAHSTSCYANNTLTSPVAIIKDLATGATSTTLGCVGPIGSGSRVPIVTAGSALATTCASTCIVDTLSDPSGTLNCSAACDLTNTTSRNNTPTYVANCAPNGTGYCLHYQGWANGNSQAIASSSYNSGTGVVTLTMTPTIYFLPGGSINVSGITGTGSVASLNGKFVTIAPTGSNTISYKIAASLTLTTNAGTGTVSPNVQASNNNSGTFGQVNEPFTLVALMTCDGYQNAGSSGGPNSAHANSDSKIKVGCQTTPTGGPGGPPTLAMWNGNTLITACSSGCTITTSISYGTWYSLLGMFNGASSWFCINGACTSVNLGGSLNWAAGPVNTNDGYSVGNASGGWGGNWLESALAAGDQHTAAATIYANQKATFGSF